MKLSNVINHMRATSAKWKKFGWVLKMESYGELSDEDVFRMLDGHAVFDDPPSADEENV